MTDPTAPLARLSPLLPLLARLLFVAILLPYYWNSALTKIGSGPFTPSAGAYAQIFPRAFEAAGYDPDKLSLVSHLVVLAGTWAEFALPALLLMGLLTRPAALAMIGFIVVQTLTDLYGHGLIAQPGVPGQWFDRAPDALLDQRALWVFLLAVPALRGGGALALDQLLFRSAPSPRPGARPAPP
ncbi:DoxX family membrane protein [Pseudooceanicola sp. CBS1P-1]|uniref:DoxX family membrane protein n=1 Tax=Pseudooceanicola albus TaxID=2692189 RepID=A0A6L7G1I0_9RHOB|nr:MULTISPECIES: DoxX family membrane protein [Pseudooceanicola]MBT9382729.1 DoxX family membrane protein [Pseudooceanicola endophyticus]MXN17267.1 DoxX family membrane protein [Pseudooceanicola albus]